MKINLIVDLQYGSTGKGLLAGFLAEETEPDILVTCNMPNAGHTYIDSQGRKTIFKVLPNGIASPKAQFVMIGPGAVFSPERLKAEMVLGRELYGNGWDVIIHPNAAVLSTEHAQLEQANLSGISSTMQGSAAATIHKMARTRGDNITAAQCAASNHDDFNSIGHGGEVVDHYEWVDIMNSANLIQAEGCQGFSLGINQRFYPYSTSRECTPHRLLSDMGLPHLRGDLKVYGSLRTFPIRVGNTEGGYSGDVHSDQHEIDWDEVGVEPELTTVTKRPRRIFTFSSYQLQEALWYCRPDHLFLNFCNYLSDSDAADLIEEIDHVGFDYGCAVTLTGHGPTYHDVRSINS